MNPSRLLSDSFAPILAVARSHQHLRRVPYHRALLLQTSGASTTFFHYGLPMFLMIVNNG